MEVVTRVEIGDTNCSTNAVSCRRESGGAAHAAGGLVTVASACRDVDSGYQAFTTALSLVSGSGDFSLSGTWNLELGTHILSP